MFIWYLEKIILIKSSFLFLLLLLNPFDAYAGSLSCSQILTSDYTALRNYQTIIGSILPEVAVIEFRGKTQTAKNMKMRLHERGWYRATGNVNTRAAIHNTFYNYVDTQHGHIVLTPILDIVINRIISKLEVEPAASLIVEEALRGKLKSIEEHHVYYSTGGRYIVDFWSNTRILTLLDSLNFLASAWIEISGRKAQLDLPLSTYERMTSFFADIGLRAWGQTTGFGINLITTDRAEVTTLSTSIGEVISDTPFRFSNSQVELASKQKWHEYLRSYFKGRLSDAYGM